MREEVMAHDHDVQKRRMEGTTGCHEASGPIGRAASSRDG